MRDALLGVQRLLSAEKSAAPGEKVPGPIHSSELAEGSPAAGKAAVPVVCDGRASVATRAAVGASRQASLLATSANVAQRGCHHKRPLGELAAAKTRKRELLQTCRPHRNPKEA